MVYDAAGARKALPLDAKAAPSAAIADAATGGGLFTGATVLGMLQTAQEQLAPLTSGSPIVAGIVVSAVLVIGGAVYGWWARRRRAELTEALA